MLMYLWVRLTALISHCLNSPKSLLAKEHFRFVKVTWPTHWNIKKTLNHAKCVASHFSITVKAQKKYKKTIAFNIAINSELNFELKKSSNYRNPKNLIISLNYCTLLFYYHNFFLIVTLFKHYQTIFILNLFLIYRT